MLSRLILAAKVFESVTSQKETTDDAGKNLPSRRKALKQILLGTAFGLAAVTGVAAKGKPPKGKKTSSKAKKPKKPKTTKTPKTSKNPSPKTPPKTTKK